MPGSLLVLEWALTADHWLDYKTVCGTIPFDEGFRRTLQLLQPAKLVRYAGRADMLAANPNRPACADHGACSGSGMSHVTGPVTCSSGGGAGKAHPDAPGGPLPAEGAPAAARPGVRPRHCHVPPCCACCTQQSTAWHARKTLPVSAAAHMLVEPVQDPVANFHLRNGASVAHLRWGADLSSRGRAGSYGIMVNYQCAAPLAQPPDIRPYTLGGGMPATAHTRLLCCGHPCKAVHGWCCGGPETTSVERAVTVAGMCWMRWPATMSSTSSMAPYLPRLRSGGCSRPALSDEGMRPARMRQNLASLQD